MRAERLSATVPTSIGIVPSTRRTSVAFTLQLGTFPQKVVDHSLHPLQFCPNIHRRCWLSGDPTSARNASNRACPSANSAANWAHSVWIFCNSTPAFSRRFLARLMNWAHASNRSPTGATWVACLALCKASCNEFNARPSALPRALTAASSDASLARVASTAASGEPRTGGSRGTDPGCTLPLCWRLLRHRARLAAPGRLTTRINWPTDGRWSWPTQHLEPAIGHFHHGPSLAGHRQWLARMQREQETLEPKWLEPRYSNLGRLRFLTGEEPRPHSGESKHALSQVGGPTQSQLSRTMSSGHHFSMEHRLRRKQLNSDTNASNRTYLKEIQEKRKRSFFRKKI